MLSWLLGTRDDHSGLAFLRIRGPQRAAFPRYADRGARDSLQLHVGKHQTYREEFNRKFARRPAESGTAVHGPGCGVAREALCCSAGAA